MLDENENVFMDCAFKEALRAQSVGEVPVGCAFVYENEVIAVGGNCVNATKNATRHAEMICMDKVFDFCSRKNLEYKQVFQEVSVFVTVEPCIMCKSALNQLKVKEIVFGCINNRFGGKTVVNIDQIFDYKIPSRELVRDSEAMELLKQFYKGTNLAAPPKSK